jgi:putative transposase
VDTASLLGSHEFTRECLAIDVDVAGSIRSSRVIEVLSKLVSVHGAPAHLRSDNGSEFVSRAVLRWLNQSKINTACIDPGKPWQNGSNESFNGKFRDECLSMQWFKNRIDAKILIERRGTHVWVTEDRFGVIGRAVAIKLKRVRY